MAACKHIGWDTIDGDGDHDDHGGDGDDHDGEVHLLLPCEAVWTRWPGVATLDFHFDHLKSFDHLQMGKPDIDNVSDDTGGNH